MSSSETDRVVGGLMAAIDAAADVDLGPMTAAERAEHVAALEVCARRFSAVGVDLVGDIGRHGFHEVDGHRSAAVMVRHVCRLPKSDARARARAADALRDLPTVAAAFRAGQIGWPQVTRLARCWANRRVRDALIAVEDAWVVAAAKMSYADFDVELTAWERLVDVDGTADADAKEEHARLRREFNGRWTLDGEFRAADGAWMSEIFDHYYQAELDRDWVDARARLGDAATFSDLARSVRQRCADAMKALFLASVTNPAGGKEPRFMINLIMGYQEHLDALEQHANEHCPNGPTNGCAADRPTPNGGPRDDSDAGPDTTGDGSRRGSGSASTSPWLPTLDQRRPCGTLSGTWIDPADMARFSIGADLRRVVLDARGVVIDLSDRNRFFTGSARDAIMLRNPRCVWAGCDTPTTACQADHHQPWSRGGRTSPDNGIPTCGHHNRFRHTSGHTIWRDPDGTWHTIRPDGTEI